MGLYRASATDPEPNTLNLIVVPLQISPLKEPPTPSPLTFDILKLKRLDAHSTLLGGGAAAASAPINVAPGAEVAQDRVEEGVPNPTP